MKTPKQNETTPAATANWVNETPPDHCYSLDMYENSDHSIDSVEMTRAEYIALKQHLATMRGLYPAPPAEPAAKGENDLGAWFAEIEEENRGCNSPAEEFITRLVSVPCAARCRPRWER
jgi:hypothetical protein